ncbi:SCO3374 family protein [Streptomyces sp. RB6PN25]|uniref:SCO3374 family protein n=1 Tax=Streptomyces humicola TaxID=2953240 RepID=A0ABT1PTJ0_9ACTN|nr:SCO3374 family protein [Streptomyces humicola]
MGPATPRTLKRQNWYERELGWATTDDRPLRLRTGLRFDALDVPAGAGLAFLRRMNSHTATGRTGPAARSGDRVLLLVAAGSAEELPGLFEWLEWSGIELDLRAHGAGGSIPAPVPPHAEREAAGDRRRPVWLRPPEPGREVEPTLPALTWSSDRSGSRCGAHDPVGLASLLGALATQCHRARLFPASSVPTEDQPCAFS